jgi:hypothetical protein
MTVNTDAQSTTAARLIGNDTVDRDSAHTAIAAKIELAPFQRTPWEGLASRVESDDEEKTQTVHGAVQG